MIACIGLLMTILSQDEKAVVGYLAPSAIWKAVSTKNDVNIQPFLESNDIVEIATSQGRFYVHWPSFLTMEERNEYSALKLEKHFGADGSFSEGKLSPEQFGLFLNSFLPSDAAEVLNTDQIFSRTDPSIRVTLNAGGKEAKVDVPLSMLNTKRHGNLPYSYPTGSSPEGTQINRNEGRKSFDPSAWDLVIHRFSEDPNILLPRLLVDIGQKIEEQIDKKRSEINETKQALFKRYADDVNKLLFTNDKSDKFDDLNDMVKSYLRANSGLVTSPGVVESFWRNAKIDSIDFTVGFEVKIIDPVRSQALQKGSPGTVAGRLIRSAK